MRKTYVSVIAFFLVFNLISLQEFAQSQGHIAPISIRDPWARTSLVSTSAAFMLLTNNQAQDDTLVRAEADVCETVELHTHIKDGDVMRMRPLKDGIVLTAHHSVSLKPGGLHIMLIGLKRPLLEGEKIFLKLYFHKAGIVSLAVPIRKPIYKKVPGNSPCGCKNSPPKSTIARKLR
ncbi:MAG: copper chaperone PCu(A)C [Alphaproteobacteria bacterium]|nr:copper chaperone PCu(A)C [Alphaproteobacteria bacterium]